jgi:hypothetical protein
MMSEEIQQLSPQKRARVEKFNKIRQSLLDNGYKEEILTISALKANIMVFITSLPIAAIGWLLFFRIYRFDYIPDIPLWIFIIVLIGIVIHELIHGFVWGYFSKEKWKSIGFGVEWKYLTPYCTCSECLSYKAYVLGAIMPTIILGLIPYIISLVTGSYFCLFFSLLLILGGGGDIYIIYSIRNHKKAILVDHPYLVGCVAFRKYDS